MLFKLSAHLQTTSIPLTLNPLSCLCKLHVEPDHRATHDGGARPWSAWLQRDDFQLCNPSNHDPSWRAPRWQRNPHLDGPFFLGHIILRDLECQDISRKWMVDCSGTVSKSIHVSWRNKGTTDDRLGIESHVSSAWLEVHQTKFLYQAKLALLKYYTVVSLKSDKCCYLS